MNEVVSKSPGEIFFFGEHSVVYGRMALAAAIDRWVTTRLKKQKRNIHITSTLGSFYAEVEGLCLRHVKADEHLVPFAQGITRVFEECGASTGFKAHIDSQLPVGSGLASSAASSASLLGGLFALLDTVLEKKRMVKIVFSSEIAIQKRGSISGSACTVLGGIVKMTGNAFEPLDTYDAYPCLVVADSKEPCLTSRSTGWVKKKLDCDRAGTESMFDAMHALAVKGQDTLRQKDWKQLGALMTQNHGYLKALGVSTEKIEHGIASVTPYVYGAKITGAGGGGCFVALCPEGNAETVVGKLQSRGFDAFECQISGCGHAVREVCKV